MGRTRPARRILVALTAVLAFSGCGYVGEPLPPALHIPQRITDLSAIERGAQIVVQFTLPAHTTDNLDIRGPATVELRVGPAGAPFEAANWEAGTKLFNDVPVDLPTVKYSLPGAEWMGKDVVIGVKVFGANGRTAGWSNLVTLSVVPPLAPPDHLQPKDVAEGVRLAWQGSASHYRIYRRAGDEKSDTTVGETDRTDYTDHKAEYGAPYRYSVEGFQTDGNIRAVSERSAEAPITTQDTYPPPVPAGLAAVVSTGSIELAWERGAAPDLAGYRIYRGQNDGPLEKLGETREVPSYSDRSIQPGKSYRYAVTAFDKLGNESEKSAPVPATAQ
jgi:hypothetical protein